MEPIDPEIPRRFEIREVLYRSEQNVRLRAFDTDLELEVILEYSGLGARQLAPSANQRRDALRQARMRAKVRHDKIQPLKEIVETPQAIVHVLEPRAGVTLDKLLETCGTLSPDEVIDLGVDLAGALQALHAAGVVHRAVAAENILMIGTGEISALSGFAFAKPIEGFGRSSLQYNPAQKETPAARALPHHPAPEQVAGQAADARSDIFAVGCVLYRCLTARTAFADHAATWVEPKNPQQLGPGIPKALAAVIMKCLRQSPMSRIPTMLQLREELLAGKQRVASGAKKPGREPWVVAAAAIVLAAAAWMVVGLFGEDSGSGRSGIGSPGVHRAASAQEKAYPPVYHAAYAILIGSNYESNPGIQDLSNPESDVTQLARDLRALGFKVTLLKGSDATKENIEDTLHELGTKLDENDQVLVYFAGHGALHPNSTAKYPSGYLLPSDAKPLVGNELSSLSWLHTSEFDKVFDEYPAKHILLAFDCCHSGMFQKMRGTGFSHPVQSAIHGYEKAYLTKKARVVMTSCTAEEGAADVSAFVKGFHEKLLRARTEPVTHTDIISCIKRIGAISRYSQAPSARNVRQTNADFVFFPK